MIGILLCIAATLGCVALLVLAATPFGKRLWEKRESEQAPGREWGAPGTEGKR